MSAYIVSKETIDRAVGMLLIEGVITSKEDASAWGKRMWLMNIEAVSQRYKHHAATDGADWARARVEADAYEFTSRPADESIAQMHKALCCLTYQCCEGDVDETPFYKLLDEIEKRPHLERLKSTPAWDEAQWG